MQTVDFRIASAKVRTISEPCKFFGSFFAKKLNFVDFGTVFEGNHAVFHGLLIVIVRRRVGVRGVFVLIPKKR